tara:strand:- start:24 stop:2501 length:2478 start_codon:yes stop_codon:yes gene_type:complete
MAIEKGLYAAPEGIDEELEREEQEELGMEIMESEDLEAADEVLLPDGSIEITLIAEIDAADMMEFDGNLAEALDDGELQGLAEELVGHVDADIESRKDWADTFVKGLDVLGFKYEERTEPWEGACGVYSTVLAEAAIRFQAETMSETFPAAGPVRVKILGEETTDKAEAAERVKADMNYELTERMVEYRPEHERMLYSLGLAGSAFKKVYYDPSLGRQVAIYIPAEDVIVPYGASHIETAERVTHVMRKTKNELKKLQSMGFYRDVDLGDPEPYHTDIEKRKAEEGGYSITDDDRYAIFEIHADIIIPGIDEDEEEIAKPYVVTIERGTNNVLAIRRNWQEEDSLFLKRNHFVHYVYVPGFGFYGLGLIHIIGGYAKAGTSIIRQLVDAGTLSNLPGGLKSRGLRIKGDDTPIEPGEWKDVDVPSGAIRDNIMPLPYKEPSQTLLALLNQITTEGKRLGAISDMNISDMSANAPVGTTLALLERTLKPMAAVQARVHYAMKQEFKLLKTIMAEYAATEYDYIPERGEVSARVSDYMMVEVIPVSDPNSSTMAQRVVQYQAVLQMSQSAPQIYDLPQLHRQMIEVLGVKNADKLVPVEDDLKPIDPVSENMNALTGTPIKAFIHQDHTAHIATHQSFMQDPMVAQMIGQNPQGQAIMAALQAHLFEHLGFQYRTQIEEQLGVQLPAFGKELPEEVEVTLAKLMAQAGTQLSQANQQKQAQQQSQKQAEDPIFQLQQKEVAIKEQEVQRKAAKDAGDMQIRTAEQDRIAQKEAIDAAIKTKQLGLDTQELELDAQKEGLRMATQTTKDQDKLSLELLRLMDQQEKSE